MAKIRSPKFPETKSKVCPPASSSLTFGSFAATRWIREVFFHLGVATADIQKHKRLVFGFPSGRRRACFLRQRCRVTIRTVVDFSPR